MAIAYWKRPIKFVIYLNIYLSFLYYNASILEQSIKIVPKFILLLRIHENASHFYHGENGPRRPSIPPISELYTQIKLFTS